MMHGQAKRLSVYQNGPSERNGRQMLVILESTNACATCYIYGVVSDDLSYRAVRIRSPGGHQPIRGLANTP